MHLYNSPFPSGCHPVIALEKHQTNLYSPLHLGNPISTITLNPSPLYPYPSSPPSPSTPLLLITPKPAHPLLVTRLSILCHPFIHFFSLFPF